MINAEVEEIFDEDKEDVDLSKQMKQRIDIRDQIESDFKEYYRNEVVKQQTDHIKQGVTDILDKVK